MTEIARAPIEQSCAWRGPDIADSGEWVHRLSAAEIGELAAAMEQAKAAHASFETVRREDFPLPTLGPVIEGWGRQLDQGRGFVLVKGFPVERYSKEDCAIAYWGIGQYLGTPVAQNSDGELLGHVRDTGEDPDDPGVRLYRTTRKQDFHTDGADIVALFCLRPSKSGGTSRIVSSVTVHNEILARRPDLHERLYDRYYWDRHDEESPGEQPYFIVPICTLDQGRLRTNYAGWYIRDAQRHDMVPRLSEDQRAVVDLVEEVANDPALYLDVEFEPGDMQFLKNSVILHQRTDYEDYDEPDRKRHLLRFWMNGHGFADSKGADWSSTTKDKAAAAD